MVRQEQVRRHDDRGQDIVEVVRDTACKLPHRLHFLALSHLVFERFLLRRFDGGNDCRLFRPLAAEISNGTHIETDMPLFITWQHGIDGRNARLPGKGSGKRPVERFAITLMHHDFKLRIAVNCIAIDNR